MEIIATAVARATHLRKPRQGNARTAAMKSWLRTRRRARKKMAWRV